MGGGLRGKSAGELDSPLPKLFLMMLFLACVGGLASHRSHPRVTHVTTLGTTTTKDEPMEINSGGLPNLKLGSAFDAAVGMQGIVDTDRCTLGIDPASGAYVYAQGGEVVLVTVRAAGVETSLGIGVGDAEREVLVGYPNATRAGDQYVVGDGTNELVVGVHGGVVTYVSARRTGLVGTC